MRRRARSWLTAALIAACSAGDPGCLAEAGDVLAVVRDQSGQPVDEAVVSAVPETRPPTSTVKPGREVVDQVNMEFVPHVKAILLGSPVYFPNKDNVRHHVYSFSPAKRFELPLYVGTPADPVVFDRPGVVTIGCNIHDWMIGYIYVAETPHLGRTGADGQARLDNLPAGHYAVRVWHPRMEPSEEATSRVVSLERGDAEPRVAAHAEAVRASSPRTGARPARLPLRSVLGPSSVSSAPSGVAP